MRWGLERIGLRLIGLRIVHFIGFPAYKLELVYVSLRPDMCEDVPKSRRITRA